jgi:membrane associated rhomboid family serine protease
MAALYFASGIGGNLFSSYVHPSDKSVGASTADFGIFTGMLAMIIINWSAFNANH